MSNFEVKVQQIFIKPHPNADAIELGNIGSPDGWQVVVKKGQFTTGDLVVYIGENAVVPDWILKRYGFWNEDNNKGKLAGKAGNRVKGIRLRGEFSLGLVIPVTRQETHLQKQGHVVEMEHKNVLVVDEGDNIAEFLGITKYEPPIPINMAGEVYNIGTHIGVNYDIEHIKNYPNVLVEGEIVQITEKIHGTFCQIVVLPPNQQYYHEDHFQLRNNNNTLQAYVAISSKGVGGRGLFFKNNDQNINNVYVCAVQEYFNNLSKIKVTEPVTICGEVFGNGVQDLQYGCTPGQIQFRMFDIYVGQRGSGRWLNDYELDSWSTLYEIPRVPVLYRGQYDNDLMLQLTHHTKSEFDSNQIREGVVIKPTIERTDSVLGRVALKSINEDYITRKNGTEFN